VEADETARRRRGSLLALGAMTVTAAASNSWMMTAISV